MSKTIEQFRIWLNEQYKPAVASKIINVLEHAEDHLHSHSSARGTSLIDSDGKTAARTISKLESDHLFRHSYKDDVDNLARLSRALKAYDEYYTANHTSEDSLTETVSSIAPNKNVDLWAHESPSKPDKIIL